MVKKHKVIEHYEKDKFEEMLDNFANENNVFATQTHVINDEGCIKYVAVCFYKE